MECAAAERTELVVHRASNHARVGVVGGEESDGAHSTRRDVRMDEAVRQIDN